MLNKWRLIGIPWRLPVQANRIIPPCFIDWQPPFALPPLDFSVAWHQIERYWDFFLNFSQSWASMGRYGDAPIRVFLSGWHRHDALGDERCITMAVLPA